MQQSSSRAPAVTRYRHNQCGGAGSWPVCRICIPSHTSSPVTHRDNSHTTVTGDQEPGYSQEMSYYQAPSSSYGVPQAPPLDSANSFYTSNNNNLPQPQQAAFYLYRGDTG